MSKENTKNVSEATILLNEMLEYIKSNQSKKDELS